MTTGVANSHAVERGAFPSSDDELREKRARFFAVSPASSSVNAAVAQSVECVLGKDEVTGSIPVSSSFDGAAHNRKKCDNPAKCARQNVWRKQRFSSDFRCVNCKRRLAREERRGTEEVFSGWPKTYFKEQNRTST